MEFTGERVVPGVTPERILADHLARYRFAARRVSRQRTLDVACGTGYGSEMLRAAGAVWVVAVDLSIEAVMYAQARGRAERLHFLAADAVTLPLGAGAVDAVVSFETLEHVPDQPAFLREVARVLRPGGRFLCSTPNRPVTTNSDDPAAVSTPFHSREFTEAEFVHLLGAHGFDVRLHVQRALPSVCATRPFRRRLLPWLQSVSGLDFDFRIFALGLGPGILPCWPGLTGRYLIAECRRI